jgi:hypothetical protein
VKPDEVKRILLSLKPFVKLKAKHIEVGLKIIHELPKATDANSFLKLCQVVDSFKTLNYSNKRSITASIVEEFLKEHDLLTPVETSPVKGGILPYVKQKTAG